VNTRWADLFACPGDGVPFLLALIGCFVDDFCIDIALYDGAMESLYGFYDLTRAGAIQAEVTTDDELIYGWLLRKVLEHCFECDLVAMNV
jgi:hypothetical protein